MRPFLSILAPGDAAELRALATTRTADPGTALLHSGAPGTTLLLLLEGRAKVVTHAADGRELLLTIAGAGDLIGELAALDGGARCASAVAIDTVRVGALNAAEFQAFLIERPSAAIALMRLLTDRMRDSDRELVTLASEDSFGRIASRLERLAERYGEAGEEGAGIELPMTQEELAGWAGSSRESVARALRLMRRLGWVKTSRRTITILDLAALSARRAAA